MAQHWSSCKIKDAMYVNVGSRPHVMTRWSAFSSTVWFNSMKNGSAHAVATAPSADTASSAALS